MRTLLAAALLTSVAAPLVAQEDFRSLDAGRPLRVMDAIPLARYEWEVQAGLGGRMGDVSGAGLAFALETGLFRNASLGIDIESSLEREAGTSRTGIEELGAHLLYSFNHESWSVPAVALALGVAAPVGGDLGRERWAASGTVVATRSFANAMRLHVNAGYTVAATTDGGDHWHAGIAADLAPGLSSRLFAADLYAEIPVQGGRSRVWTGVGARIQAGNRNVVDVGIATRLDTWSDGDANLEVRIGLSRVFGIAGLMPVPRYPDPSIR